MWIAIAGVAAIVVLVLAINEIAAHMLAFGMLVVSIMAIGVIWAQAFRATEKCMRTRAALNYPKAKSRSVFRFTRIANRAGLSSVAPSSSPHRAWQQVIDGLVIKERRYVGWHDKAAARARSQRWRPVRWVLRLHLWSIRRWLSVVRDDLAKARNMQSKQGNLP